jgi:hypothetical protein
MDEDARRDLLDRRGVVGANRPETEEREGEERQAAQ